MKIRRRVPHACPVINRALITRVVHEFRPLVFVTAKGGSCCRRGTPRAHPEDYVELVPHDIYTDHAHIGSYTGTIRTRGSTLLDKYMLSQYKYTIKHFTNDLAYDLGSALPSAPVLRRRYESAAQLRHWALFARGREVAVVALRSRSAASS